MYASTIPAGPGRICGARGPLRKFHGIFIHQQRKNVGWNEAKEKLGAPERFEARAVRNRLLWRRDDLGRSTQE